MHDTVLNHFVLIPENIYYSCSKKHREKSSTNIMNVWASAMHVYKRRISYLKYTMLHVTKNKI